MLRTNSMNHLMYAFGRIMLRMNGVVALPRKRCLASFVLEICVAFVDISEIFETRKTFGNIITRSQVTIVFVILVDVSVSCAVNRNLFFCILGSMYLILPLFFTGRQ